MTPLPRHQFPVAGAHRYLNHAGLAPLSRAAAEAGRAFLDEVLHHGALGYDDWERRADQVRASAGHLLNVPAADVAFVKNTTEGLAFVAGGLDWRPGDRVVITGGGFPSSVYPWVALRDRGVRVDALDPVGPGRSHPVDAFAEALAAGPVRLVAVSWVHYGTGARVDLAALGQLCHEHGALLCVDAIQGVGVIPADLTGWGVAFASCAAHKWLLGPLGTGLLYVAGDHRDRLRPLEPGWASVAHRQDYGNLELVYDDSARRFEGGMTAFESVLQMGASLDLLLGAGVDAVWAHVRALLDRLAEGLARAGATVLSDLDPAVRSGHLAFAVPGVDPVELWRALQAERIVCAPRGGGVRIAPHGYNTADEIDAVVAVAVSTASAARA